MNQIDPKSRATIGTGRAGADRRIGGAAPRERRFYPLDPGGGARHGYRHGATSELEPSAAAGKAHGRDLDATILHMLGFNHETFTCRYAGPEFRLNDVFGEVASKLIA